MKKSSVKQNNRWPKIDLRKIEEETLEEGRKWMQNRMEEKLREQTAAFSPDGGEAPPECPAPEAHGQNPGRRRRPAGRVRTGS